MVPYVEDEHTIFLKTIIPSRKMNKLYNKAVDFESHSDKGYHFQDFSVSIHINHFQTNAQTPLFSFPVLNMPVTQQLVHLFDLYFAILPLQH
jgi:hypothetical protein